MSTLLESRIQFHTLPAGYKYENCNVGLMRPKTTVAIVLLFFLNAFSASFATIPVQSDVELFFSEASETSARNSSCGTNSTLTDLSISMDASSYTQGSSAIATYYINCSVNGDYYDLYVSISGPSVQSYPGWNWTESNAYESFNSTIYTLTVGTFCVNASLYATPSGGNFYLVDTESHCFTVSSTSSGGGGSSTYVPNGSLAINGVSSSYSNGSNVTTYFAYTNLDTGVTYGEMWHLTDANGNVVQGYGVNQTWNATSSNYTSSSVLAGLSAGFYCITATLYTVYSNGTATILSTTTTCFTIAASTPTTSCGTNSTLTDLMIWMDASSYTQGSSATATYYINCTVVNGFYVLDVWTYGPSYQVYNGWNWTAYSAYESMNTTVSNLASGTYCTNATLYYYPSSGGYQTADSESHCFTVSSTSSGGGGSSTYVPNGSLAIYGVSSNYSSGSNVTAFFDYTNLDVGVTYGEMWRLFDANDMDEPTVQGYEVNQTWNATSSNYTSSSVLAGLSAGTYCIDATLYAVYSNGTAVILGYDLTCFTVTANNNGGGGTGTQDPCGTNSTLTDLMIWMDASSYTQGDSATATYLINCTVINGFYVLDVWTYGPSYQVYNGWNWTAYSAYESINSTVSNLASGTYCTNATLYYYPSTGGYQTVDSESRCFTVSSTSSGGGGSTTYIPNGSLAINGVSSSYSSGSNVTAFFDYTNLDVGVTYGEMWRLFDANDMDEPTVQGYEVNQTWNATSSNYTSSSVLAGLSAGTYCIDATLYAVYSNGTAVILGYDLTCFTVTANNNGGGGTGTQDPCGLNSSYTLIMSWSDAQTYNYGDSQNISFYVNCTRTGEAYTLEYFIWDGSADANYVASGSYSWTASGVWHSWSDYVYGLDPGDWCVYTNLLQAGNYLTNDGGINCFTVVETTGNTPPTLVAAQQALIAYAGDPLDCYANGMVFNDPDNDPDNSNIEWYVNGNSVVSGVQTILPAGSVSLGDTLYCEATAHDGTTSGNTLQRHYYVVPSNNTAPTVSAITISPTSPEESDPLTCSYTYNDPESDPDASIVVWSINGVATTTQGTTLSSGYATGDFVTCSVTAFDGSSIGNTGTGTVLVFSPGSSGGGSTPTIGVLGTLAVLCVAFVLVSRKEFEE